MDEPFFNTDLLKKLKLDDLKKEDERISEELEAVQSEGTSEEEDLLSEMLQKKKE